MESNRNVKKTFQTHSRDISVYLLSIFDDFNCLPFSLNNKQHSLVSTRNLKQVLMAILIVFFLQICYKDISYSPWSILLVNPNLFFFFLSACECNVISSFNS